MHRVTEPKKSMISLFADNDQVVHSRPNLTIYPQMPLKQIHHFVIQAVRRQQSVIVQLNPSSFSKQLNEVVGTLKLSPRSSHVILTTETQNTIHLIQLQQIRHLRLA